MSTIQNNIYNGAVAAGANALVMGLGAWGFNQIGLAKKITGKAAPTLMDAAKYGLVRGAVTFGVTVFSGYVNGQIPKSNPWAKRAINVGALAVFYFSVPHVAQAAKKHLNVSIHERFQYLALFGEGLNFYFNGMK